MFGTMNNDFNSRQVSNLLDSNHQRAASVQTETDSRTSALASAYMYLRKIICVCVDLYYSRLTVFFERCAFEGALILIDTVVFQFMAVHSVYFTRDLPQQIGKSTPHSIGRLSGVSILLCAFVYHRSSPNPSAFPWTPS
jgi:hypothetical protein